MSEPFLGEIRAFGFGYAPRFWAQCNGQLISIQQNAALFSLIGTYYGGNGTTNFALPNLQGNAACSSGSAAGSGLTPRALGQRFGSTAVALQTAQLPAHTHAFTAMIGSGTQEVNAPVAGCHLGRTIKQFDYLNADTANTPLAPTIGATGSGTAHANQQPYLVLNFCICLQGNYPQRP